MDQKRDIDNRITSPEQIQQMARAFQGSRILLTAFELDLFTVLDNGPQTSADVATKLDTDSRATDRLLNALCVLGLIEKSDEVFSNTETSSQFLVQGKEQYISGLAHINNLWDTWSTLTGSVTRDKEKAEKRSKKKIDSWYDSFIAAMHNRAAMTAPAIVSQLDLTGVSKILDVGGGSGAFSIQFVKQNKDVIATVFDLPHVVKMTQSYVEEAGISDRIRFAGGDYVKDDDLGTDYDLVFLSAIIHSNSPEMNKKMFKKCYNALSPGGRIVVQDFIMDDNRTTPAVGAVFALNMLVATPEGDSYTKSEISDWLTEVGFKKIRQLPPIGPTSSIIAAK